MHTKTNPVKHMSTDPCPCGCAECDHTCCRLDCLVRPRFFCGQLLTDQDMTALINWTQQKFALARYRQGWGVVCGLEVRCDHTKPGVVVVEPGYAIGCCGDDIVVCAPEAKDLSAACRDVDEICYDPLQVSAETVKRQRANGGESTKYSLSGEYGDDVILCWPDARLEDATVVDLYINYHEEHIEPQEALTRGTCGQTVACDYSRTRESFRLSWRHVNSDTRSGQVEPSWPSQYADRVPVVQDFLDAGLESDDWEATLEWLRLWVKHHPPQRFCFVLECIDDTARQLERDKNREFGPALTDILFWLAVDYQLELLSCDCYGCEPDSGVPLARVWLKTRLEGYSPKCRILAIDSHSPFRRLHGPECWTVAPGCNHAAQIIWRSPDEATATLRVHGIQVTLEEYSRPSTAEELARLLSKYRDLELCGPAVTLLWCETIFGKRVIGCA